MRRHYIITMVIVAIFISCGSDNTQPPVSDQTEEVSLYDKVYENCLAVELAAFRFALDNGVSFPGDVSDVNDAGKTIADYLPGGQKLVNPATGLATEPSDFVRPPAGDPTAITEYEGWDADADGLVDAFIVAGFTDPEAEPSQPQIVFCVASEESGICGP